jgi:hypothetical protein
VPSVSGSTCHIVTSGGRYPGKTWLSRRSPGISNATVIGSCISFCSQYYYRTGTIGDLTTQRIELKEGQPLILYSEDLEVDRIVEYSQSEHNKYNSVLRI